MSERELLELIVKRLDAIEDDITGMKSDITDMKSEMTDMKSEMTDMKSEMTDMKSEMTDMKSDITGMKSDISKLKAEQSRISSVLENTVDKCVQVLYESHTLNAERFDKYDIESIKRNSDIAAAIAKAAYDMASKKAV